MWLKNFSSFFWFNFLYLKIFFFTKEMSDEFIGEAVEYCENEVKKLRGGEPGIDMLAYAWKRAGV